MRRSPTPTRLSRRNIPHTKGNDDVSYHDFTPKTEAGRIGKAIYLEALDDWRGFRYDQLGIEDDELWEEIFEAMGEAALKAIKP